MDWRAQLMYVWDIGIATSHLYETERDKAGLGFHGREKNFPVVEPGWVSNPFREV